MGSLIRTTAEGIVNAAGEPVFDIVAWEGETVFGFIPVEITDGGVAKINNYYVSGDDPHLLSRFLREIIQYYRRDYTIRSMTLIRHAEIFRSEGFVPMKEWTQYVTMEYSKNR